MCVSLIARVSSCSILHNFGYNLFHASNYLKNSLYISPNALVACELQFVQGGFLSCVLADSEVESLLMSDSEVESLLMSVCTS